MNKKIDYDGIYSILAAFFVLFSAMLNPIVSLIFAISFLLALGIKILLKNRKKSKRK